LGWLISYCNIFLYGVDLSLGTNDLTKLERDHILEIFKQLGAVSAILSYGV
jgi:hypothetical protein